MTRAYPDYGTPTHYNEIMSAKEYQRIRAAIIEECARVVEEMSALYTSRQSLIGTALSEAAAAIRSLKDKP